MYVRVCRYVCMCAWRVGRVKSCIHWRTPQTQITKGSKLTFFLLLVLHTLYPLHRHKTTHPVLIGRKHVMYAYSMSLKSVYIYVRGQWSIKYVHCIHSSYTHIICTVSVGKYRYMHMHSRDHVLHHVIYVRSQVFETVHVCVCKHRHSCVPELVYALFVMPILRENLLAHAEVQRHALDLL